MASRARQGGTPNTQAGPLEFECQVLHFAETGQRVIAYCAAPGSATARAFEELARATIAKA